MIYYNRNLLKIQNIYLYIITNSTKFKTFNILIITNKEHRITSNKRPLLLNAPLLIKNYLITPALLNAPPLKKNPLFITDEDITEAVPQFTLIKEDHIDINVEDDILVVD